MDLTTNLSKNLLGEASRSMLDFQQNQHRRRENLQNSVLEASMSRAYAHGGDDEYDEAEEIDFESNILNLKDQELDNPEFPRGEVTLEPARNTNCLQACVAIGQRQQAELVS